MLFLLAGVLPFTSCGTFKSYVASYSIGLSEVESPADSKQQFGETKVVGFNEEGVDKYRRGDGGFQRQVEFPPPVHEDSRLLPEALAGYRRKLHLRRYGCGKPLTVLEAGRPQERRRSRTAGTGGPAEGQVSASQVLRWSLSGIYLLPCRRNVC